MNNNIVSLKVPFDIQPLSTEFNVKWTPTLVTVDSDGKEHHHTVGFLSPEELIPSLLLGMAKVHFDLNQFPEALAFIEKVLADFPKSGSAAEAIFLRGVSIFKSANNPKALKDAYEQLQAQYPESDWTKRAYPYRLL